MDLSHVNLVQVIVEIFQIFKVILFGLDPLGNRDMDNKRKHKDTMLLENPKNHHNSLRYSHNNSYQC
jgi:hypothetical protein